MREPGRVELRVTKGRNHLCRGCLVEAGKRVRKMVYEVEQKTERRKDGTNK